MAQTDYNTNSITVKLSPKGKYYWEITLSNFLNDSETITRLQELDSKLQRSFPKNSLIIQTSSRFSQIDDLDE